jgi:hypothetical protein
MSKNRLYKIDETSGRVWLLEDADGQPTQRTDVGSTSDEFAVAYDTREGGLRLASHGLSTKVAAVVEMWRDDNLLLRKFHLNETMLKRLNGALAGLAYDHLSFVNDAFWSGIEGVKPTAELRREASQTHPTKEIIAVAEDYDKNTREVMAFFS